MTPARTFVALVHGPVWNRNHERIASAVTHLDLHDIARTARTYGLGGYLLCHPVAAQRELVARILAHWNETENLSAHRRREALRLVRLAPDLEAARATVAEACGEPPFVLATSAASRPGAVGFREVAGHVGARPLLLAFGTGWGMCDEVFDRVDATLESIDVGSGYNHLPVRVAVAIVLDRLLGGFER
ncbi:MAG: RNA methyltransferase [Myxococcota bacterium]